MLTITQIYLEKRLKVLLPKGGTKEINRLLVATLAKNFESLGYNFTPKLFRALAKLTEAQLTEFYTTTLPVLKQMRGAHRRYCPMYPNFPQQVIDASDFELYWNAICHYWSFWAKDLGLADDTWLPEYEKKERMPLAEPTKLDTIDLGTEQDFKSIFTTLVSAKSSISESDKQIVEWFVQTYRDRINLILPETITMKEQVALVAGLILKYTPTSAVVMTKYVKTPTDVLRVAAAFAGGDVSLAEAVKFKKFSRPVRRFLLTLLEACKTDIAQEMVKYQSRWQRLGEVIHPGEYAKQFPRSFAAFKAIRNEKVQTFNGKVEAALQDDVSEAVSLLVTRPGDFARRLDHVLRMSEGKRAAFAKKFLGVADKVSTTVLLQLFTHFKTRSEVKTRSVFPKGNLAKIHVLETTPPTIDERFCLSLAEKIRNVLVKRFAALDNLGKVYLDPTLKNYLVPFSQRSAAKALRTIVRGSQIPLDGDYDTVRFFVWWKNMNAGQVSETAWNDGDRVDIDLTASILREDFTCLTDVAYYNLRDFAGHHSGDITNAPRGASEFIDISLDAVLQGGGRYVVMCINSYTQHKYCDLPECFAGWMGRKSPNSGEIYEAKTVKNKIDIASDTTVVLPLVIDAKTRRVVWMDLGLKQRPSWNNVRNNAGNISLVVKAMTELHKPNLYDLLSMHIDARGKVAKTPEAADVVFSPETIAFDTDTVLTKYV